MDGEVLGSIEEVKTEKDIPFHRTKIDTSNMTKEEIRAYQTEVGKRNLIPLNKRSKEEVRAIQEKGRLKGHETRRRKKTFQEIAKTMLERKVSVETLEKCLNGDIDMLINDDGTLDTDTTSVIMARMCLEAMEGNVKCAEYVRDSSGNKPRQEVSVEAITDNDRMLLDKVSNRLNIEQKTED